MEKINSDDLELFKLIEEYREQLKKDQSIIEIADYGAGDPKDSRSAIESYNGVTKSTTVSKQCAIGIKGEYVQILYSLVKEYKPKNILELGTCCGFSSIYMSKASKQSQIYTIEGDKTVADIAQKNLEHFECKNVHQYIGRFQDILIDVLKEINQVDFAFIDGHHDKVATLEYFEIIKPFLTQKAIVVFDDISWSDGMKEAWQKISNDPFFQEKKDHHKIGVCFR
jgi:predicted O-methyltransferase YrrM